MNLQTGPHWHAYAYTSPPGVTPDDEEWSLDPDDWLKRPAAEIVATLLEPEEAATWMQQQLAAYPPWSEGAHGYVHATLYTRQYLHRQQDQTPWAHYVDRHDRVVVRVLAACPRPRPPSRPAELYAWETPVPPCPLAKPEP
ncbi:hypothetical protein AB0469_32000 [Streptomyces sp. NPDC093801]|uniref:hypothetical protein n=1 Tax=Streptomyces sp. NPDC093801 TaxID=3155203 RepID=UPI003450E1DD